VVSSGRDKELKKTTFGEKVGEKPGKKKESLTAVMKHSSVERRVKERFHIHGGKTYLLQVVVVGNNLLN